MPCSPAALHNVRRVWRPPFRRPAAVLVAFASLCAVQPLCVSAQAEDVTVTTPRRPQSDAELRSWLESFVWRHRFGRDEIQAALGLGDEELTEALARFDIRPDNAPPLPADRVYVLPYPGGRHPRIGFLDGAIDPQRETKVSIFTPWQPADHSRADYVVADVPEAIWSNLGLTYLAHTHVPTIWTQQNVPLEPLEWSRGDDGALELKRRLPNGIEFGTVVTPKSDHVAMEMTLTNGTDRALSDLRVQNCVMLRGAQGFDQQTNDNKRFVAPYAAARDASGRRWIISAWKPNHRTWGNAPCPCLHSDPLFPDCAPGETQRLRGWLSFYEGDDLDAELARIESLQWEQPE
ncbi:MAG: hypothetical protein KF774_19570 [Planctomyces sp.]|nr:hypothetical protein [Planctomyces sp.]